MGPAMNSNVLGAVFATRGFRSLHPLHAMLLAFTLPSFLGAWINDVAYASTYQIQWTNFAAWLIVGGLVGGGLALAWALIELARDRAARTPRLIAYAAFLALIWAFGLINAFIHSRDAWASMPEATWLSAITTLFALAASWIGFAGLREEGQP
jgi:uncharacterized membrane protein